MFQGFQPNIRRKHGAFCLHFDPTDLLFVEIQQAAKLMW
jgi:hypothetical protein